MRWATCYLLISALPSFAQVWQQLPDFPGTARDDAASFHHSDRIFVGTGMDVGFQLTNDWYAYSLITQSWESIAALPASGRQYCNGFSMGYEHGYLFGGVDANGPLNELWCYDPLTNNWIQRASLPGPGRYACAVLVSGGQAYICGGMLDGGIPTNEVWRYDLVSDTWEVRMPMPGTPRHRAAVVDNVVVGGADSSFQAVSEAYAFNPINDQWTARPDLPAPRFGASAVEHLFFCGASSLAQNHDEVLLHDWSSGNYDGSIIPPFPGGPRKGGIASSQNYVADVGLFFYGLGIDGPTRYKDWWMLAYGTGLDEHAIGTASVFPNPASTHLTPMLPQHWAMAVFRIYDTVGRTLVQGRVLNSQVIGVDELSAGRYELWLEFGDERLRAPFIKLP